MSYAVQRHIKSLFSASEFTRGINFNGKKKNNVALFGVLFTNWCWCVKALNLTIKLLTYRGRLNNVLNIRCSLIRERDKDKVAWCRWEITLDHFQRLCSLMIWNQVFKLCNETSANELLFLCTKYEEGARKKWRGWWRKTVCSNFGAVQSLLIRSYRFFDFLEAETI